MFERLAGDWWMIAAGAAIKSVALLGGAWAILLRRRGASASFRHMVWLMALGSLIALPLTFDTATVA